MKFTNRQIKFRVWTGSSMEYRVVAGALGHFYVEGISKNDAACLSEANTIYDKKTPLMQWTGLVDKNGVDIYEGDVVLDPTANGEIYKKVERLINGEFTAHGKQWHDQLYSRCPYCMVIGNIFENPELLNAP